MEQQTAKLNFLRIAPRKTRSVADLIRGMHVNDAEAQLMIQRRRPAQSLLKLLRSAVANAKNNKLNVDHLFVAEIRVDGGPMLKRYLPRARGSASPIQKKMSHVTITLRVNPKLSPKYKINVPKKVKGPAGSPGADRPRKSSKVEDEGGAPKNKQNFFKRMLNNNSRGDK